MKFSIPGRGSAAIRSAAVAVYLWGLAAAEAQFMQPEPTSATAPPPPDDVVLSLWQKFLGPDSLYRPIILSVTTLFVLLAVYKRSTGILQVAVRKHAYTQANADFFLKTWRVVWKFAIAVLVVIAMSGSFKVLGLTAGFLGMMLGWSLQAPVTGMAAWLMIIFKKPFRLGDRIIVAGYTGDVTEISLTHIVLNQVGGSVGGEERSGRGILIPNAILFSNVIINFTLDAKYMLDEVPVRLTFDSDYDFAEELCLAAVHAEIPEIIKDAAYEPNVRCEFYDHGILARVRYQTIPSDRQRISTEISKRILRCFKENADRVKFCYPHQVIRFRNDESGTSWAGKEDDGD